ncbi:SLATT domain-containing protein [Aeromonas veronii]|uniref:SLATT domain-containing protein n=1 Tax=Aeromonas veronii TaxID=654 RepID=UPI003BA07796
MSDTLSTHAQKMQKQLKTTAYARFFSARRYEKLNNCALFSLTSFSLLLIFTTLLQKYSTIPGVESQQLFKANILELGQLISSIIIAILSITVSFGNYATKAEKMRQSAELINNLSSSISDALAYGNVDKDMLNEIRSTYNEIKQNSMNHLHYEYVYGRAERKKESDEIKITLSEVDFYSKIKYLSPFIIFYSISIASALIFIISTFIFFQHQLNAPISMNGFMYAKSNF